MYMKLYRCIYFLFVTVILVSCYNEMDNVYNSNEVDKNCFSISFESDRMLPQTVTSRVSDPKTEAEKEIRSLHIFFFGPDKKFLTGKYLEGYPQSGVQGGYCTPSQGATILKIDRSEGAFDNVDAASKATIVAIANVEETTFPLNETTRRPSNINTLDDLLNFVYKPNNGVALGLPTDGMPMLGIKYEQNLVTNATNALTIDMQALMARIDVNVQIDSEHGSTGGLPRMQLVEWTAKNLPLQVPLIQPSKTLALGDNKRTITTKSTQQITNRTGEISLSFYMFENIQEKTGEYNYPDSVEVDERQRYKPLIADTENATCIELHTFYTTYNNYLYDATYTLYLGANHTDDFKVYRNRQYKNNVTVKGITKVGNNPDHITLDARVNITTDNPFFISILRERNHDAHFCVTPMDVYMFQDNDETDNVKMEVSISEPDDHTWIRMEKVTAAQMLAGEAPNEKCIALGKENPYHAGNGKRRYFTTSLMSELVDNHTITLYTSRDRIYFYIDENLTLEDRFANIHFKYTGPDGTTKERDMQISQTHLLPVTIEEYYDPELLDGGVVPWLGKGAKRTVTIYMEVVEEYLEHYDPLNEFNENIQKYNGLPWGGRGKYIGNEEGLIFKKYKLKTDVMSLQWEYNNKWYDTHAEFEVSQNWYQGLLVTNRIIQDLGHSEMNLNEQPESAAEYCYNRNKRDDKGNVLDPSKKWFLPGIRQMEKSLTKYYNQFSEFQNNFYWSSSASEAVGETSGQSPDYARSTKIDPNGNYIESGGQKPEYPSSGRASRDVKLRIRAFRVDLEPIK